MTDASISVGLLADHPDLISEVGVLRWTEWGYDDPSPDAWIDITAREAGRDGLPVTLVAVADNGSALGVVGLDDADDALTEVERAGRTPWLVGLVVGRADRLATFWSSLLDRELSDEMDEPGWATVGSRHDPEPRITFQRVPEPRSGKVRLHLDVAVDDIATGMAGVKRLGGASTGERHDYDEGVVVVMTDPEGHEFCLVQFYE